MRAVRKAEAADEVARSACGATSPTPTSRVTRPSPSRSRPSATPSTSRPGPGVEPPLRHLANSAATLTLPEAHFDLVRPGIAVYGLSPVPGDFGLVPAMTLRAGAASVKRVRAGEGVSYGHEYVTDRETTLVLVPLGYADGVPRARVEHRPGLDQRAARAP